LEAKQAISFFIHLVNFHVRDGPFPQPLAMENDQTREKFVVTKATTTECERKRNYVWIWRHPVEANSEWIEEMTKYEDHYEYGNIAIDFWSYLGISI
jgi:hypothetical protein